MMSETHRIEASPPTPTVDDSPPPPSYEEANNVFTTPMHNGSSYGLDYFLGEVSELNSCFKYYLTEHMEPTLFIITMYLKVV